MKKILILGSCVSRDIFEFDKGFLELVGYYARTSLASLAADSYVKEEYLESLCSNFQKTRALWDMRKDFWDFLERAEFDFLLLDFIDDRFYLYKDEAKAFTLSDELYKKNKHNLDFAKIFNKESKEFNELFSFGLKRLKKALGEKQLIVNAVYFTDNGGGDYDELVRINSYFSKEYLQEFNAYLQERYAQIRSIFPKALFIDYEKGFLKYDENNKWGLSPVHYVQNVYKFALGKLYEYSEVIMNKEDVKVGVIVPIYNVLPYLTQCLESILSQSHKNLQIVLVDDGSTDGSFELAKQYCLKDKRVVLIRKKNAGQGSAKNVGIEYFANTLHFKFDERTEETLKVYKADENEWGVEKLYKQEDNEFTLIDYLIFIDSDDFWEKDLVSTYVEFALKYNPDILWADFRYYYDGTPDLGLKTNFENYGLKKQGLIDIDEWESLVLKLKSCPFTWQGMLDFKFFKSLNLRFLNETTQEDLHFGALLFAQSQSIFVLQKRFYHYRIRKDSTCSYNQSYDSLPTYLQSLYSLCNEDVQKTKEYNSFHNYFKISCDMICFIQNSSNQKAIKIIREIFLPTYVKRFTGIFKQSIDPLNLKQKYYKIAPYLHFIDSDGAVFKVKNHLKFKIGSLLMDYKKGLFNTWVLVYKIVYCFLKHQFSIKMSKIFRKKKTFPLECYNDYKQALKIQDGEIYKLGESFLKTPLLKVKEFLKHIERKK